MKENLKKVKFLRFGGLSPVIQYGYGNNTFHAPPAKKGIYAFPYPFIEWFLLGGNYADPKKSIVKNPTNRIQYLRDKKGNLIDTNHPDYEKHSACDKNWTADRRKTEEDDFYGVLYRPSSRKIFEYKGDIWHHLECKNNFVVNRHNDWILTNYKNYTDCLSKHIHKQKFDRMHGKFMWLDSKTCFGGNTVLKAPQSFFNKDDIEVFIERIK